MIDCVAFAARSTPISPSLARHQPVQPHLQPGYQGSRQHRQRQSARFAARQVGSISARSRRPSARTQPLFDRFSAYVVAVRPICRHAAAVPEQCGFGGRYFGRAFDPSQMLGDCCFESDRRIALRPAAQAWCRCAIQAQLYGFTDYGGLYTRDAASGTSASQHAASVGGGIRLGWLDHVNADLSAAKAIEGPRNDWRFFFIL